MIAAIKAEFRKLLTVRSTYILTGFALALEIFLGFYIFGWRATGVQLHDPTQFTSSVLGSLNLMGIFSAIVVILLMTHEYRYNTILYSLTASNSRSKTLLAKILVVSVYGLVVTALIAAIGPLTYYLGVHAHGHMLVPQTIHWANLIWRSLFYGWAITLVGFLLAAIVRSQVVAIATLLVFPNVIEELLALFLKHTAAYLPFAALSSVIGQSRLPDNYSLMPGKAAATVGVYVAVAAIVAWILFLRRDASSS